MPHLLIKFLLICFIKEQINKDFIILRSVNMKEIDKFPKLIKKAVRYIKQDASKEQLEEIRKLIDYAIKLRSVRLD